MQVSLNEVVPEELVAHDIHLIVIQRLLPDGVVRDGPETDSYHIFLTDLNVEYVFDVVLESVEGLIVGHLNINLHKELHEAIDRIFLLDF